MKRRSFLTGGAPVVAGLTVGVAGASTGADAAPELPWPYEPLDVEETRLLGHTRYYESNCASGAFQAIVMQLAERIGDPWASLPLDVFEYGGGGVAGWGTLCGSLNGASGVITMAAGPSDAPAIVSELLGWYTGAAFPSDESNGLASAGTYSAGGDMSGVELGQSVSISPLCHVSVSRWCDATGLASGTDERKERCARLAGDVAAKAVALLNDHYHGGFNGVYEPSSETARCLSCHAPGEDFGKGAFSMGKMDCEQCHEPHPVTTGVASETPSEFGISGNFPNPFNPSTAVRFITDMPGHVRIDVYNVLGQRVRVLFDAHVSRGIHRVVWNGQVDDGSPAAQGMYIVRMEQAGRQASHSMLMIK